MLKFLGFLIVVGFAFALGFQVGRQGPEPMLKKARDLSAEVVEKATAFERSTSVRTSLVTAKEHLIQAKADLLEKNYGKAVSGLEETAKMLAQARAAAEEELRPKLDTLKKKVSDLAAEAKSLKPGVMTKLNEAIRELDALLTR